MNETIQFKGGTRTHRPGKTQDLNFEILNFKSEIQLKPKIRNAMKMRANRPPPRFRLSNFGFQISLFASSRLSDTKEYREYRPTLHGGPK
jgi:hypothetical protein